MPRGEGKNLGVALLSTSKRGPWNLIGRLRKTGPYQAGECRCPPVAKRKQNAAGSLKGERKDHQLSKGEMCREERKPKGKWAADLSGEKKKLRLSARENQKARALPGKKM